MDTNVLVFAIALLLNLVGFIWLVVVGFKRSIAWGILIFLLSPFSAIIFAVTNWYDAKGSFLLYFITLIAVLASGFLIVEQHGGVERFEKVSAALESGQIKENEVLLYLDPNTLLPGEEDDSEEAELGIDLDGDGIIDTPEAVITGEEPESVSRNNLTESDSKRGTDRGIEAGAKDRTKRAETDNDEELVVIIEEKQKALSYPTPGTIVTDPLVAPKKKVKSGSVRVKLSKINNYIGRYFIVTTKKGNEHRGILVKVTKSRFILERKIYGGTFRYKISRKRVKRIDMLKKEYIDELS